MAIPYNGNLDAFYDAVGASVAADPIDISTCIFRFVRLNHSLKSVEEMANEILQYGWSDSYGNAVAAIKSNLLLDQPDAPASPPSLLDGLFDK